MRAHICESIWYSAQICLHRCNYGNGFAGIVTYDIGLTKTRARSLTTKLKSYKHICQRHPEE